MAQIDVRGFSIQCKLKSISGILSDIKNHFIQKFDIRIANRLSSGMVQIYVHLDEIAHELMVLEDFLENVLEPSSRFYIF